MTRTFFLSFMFLAAACGGSDNEPKGPSTTSATAPEEKSEEDIKMSPGNPAPAAKPASKPAESKPAAPAPTPAPAPAPTPAPK